LQKPVAVEGTEELRSMHDAVPEPDLDAVGQLVQRETVGWTPEQNYQSSCLRQCRDVGKEERRYIAFGRSPEVEGHLLGRIFQ
jgi:hypothetical protein